MKEKQEFKLDTCLTAEERAFIEKLSKKKELSEQAVLRQALRTLQLVESWMNEDEPVMVKFDQTGMHCMDGPLSKKKNDS